MGNEPSQRTSQTNDAATNERQQQLQELHDLSSNYLDHLEQIIDSRHTVDDPRVIISILKHNLKTARAQIGKIHTPSTKHNRINHKKALQSTDTTSCFSYDWSDATTEQIHFDPCTTGKIHGIQIATSTYEPVMMTTVSEDAKCRIWKLRSKSKHYEMMKRGKNARCVQRFEVDGLQEIYSSYSNEITDDEFTANLSDHSSQNDNKKSENKELHFELCHEMKLPNTGHNILQCVAIHCEGNALAIADNHNMKDNTVQVFDLRSLHKPTNNAPRLHKKQRSLSKLFTSKNTSNPSSVNNKESAFDLDSNALLLCELCLWKRYISCIEFLNDDQHIMVGSGDATLTICNYQSIDKIWCWTADSDVLCVDYLYLDNSRRRTRDKSAAIHRKVEAKNTKNRWSFKPLKEREENENVTFAGVPMVAGDFDDGDSSDSSDEESPNNMSMNTMYQRVYDYDYVSRRQVLVLIATASCVFIDEVSLSIDEYDKLDIVSAKKNHLAQFKQKPLLSKTVQFSYSVSSDKPCNTIQCRFSPNGRFFAIGGEAKYEIYDRNSLKPIHERYVTDCKKMKDCYVMCLTWINERTVAVGNKKGECIYTSTVLNDEKIRSFVMKEWMITHHVCHRSESGLNPIMQEVHAFIGYDVIDNRIQTTCGGQITSCLTSHPYFAMRSINNNTFAPSTPNQSIYNRHTMEGLCVAGSWNAALYGCVLND
eukprot:1140180_1